MANLHTLEDGALLESLRGLEARHRETMACIVEHLVELERRGLHLSLGYPSLYEYCTRALGLSEDEAFRRITVARMAVKQPSILAGLADGSLHLSGLVALKPHLGGAPPEVAEGLLELARHQSRREIERRLAARFPEADAPELVRRERGKIDPLSPGRYRVQLTIDQRTRDQLERALELMSHQNPEHALAPLLSAALDALVEQLERSTRAKLTARPTRAKTATAAKTVTAAKTAKTAKTVTAAKTAKTATAAKTVTAAKPQQRANEPPQFDERQLDLWELAATSAPSAPAPLNPDAPHQQLPTEPIRQSPKPPARHVPRPLRRAAFERAGRADGADARAGDSASCCFISESGQRCGSRHFLEIDHEAPWVVERRHRPSNLRVLCGAHNRWAARELMGARDSCVP